MPNSSPCSGNPPRNGSRPHDCGTSSGATPTTPRRGCSGWPSGRSRRAPTGWTSRNSGCRASRRSSPPDSSRGSRAPSAVAPNTPKPAQKVSGHVDRETEERALAAFQRADEERAEAERRLGVVRQAHAAASAEAGDEPTGRLASLVEELEERYAQARVDASGLHPAQEALLHAERERDRRIAAQQEAAVRAASRDTRRDALERERASLEGELTQARGDAESVAVRAAQLERRAALLGGAAEAARVADDTAQRLKDADARLADAAFRAGFDTPQAAAAAVLDDAAHRDLQHRLDARQSEEAAVRAVLAEAETAAAAQRPPADLATAEQDAVAAARRLQDTVSAWDAAERRRAELDRLSARATASVRRLRHRCGRSTTASPGWRGSR